MEVEFLKKAYEGINHLLTDEAAFNGVVDKLWNALEAAKGGALDVETLEKGINDAILKAGGKKVLEREHVEKLLAALTSDKAKGATRDSVAKHIRDNLEKKKAQLESLKK